MCLVLVNMVSLDFDPCKKKLIVALQKIVSFKIVIGSIYVMILQGHISKKKNCKYLQGSNTYFRLQRKTQDLLNVMILIEVSKEKLQNMRKIVDMIYLMKYSCFVRSKILSL